MVPTWPGDSAFELSGREMYLTLAWSDVVEAAAARAAARRIRRGVGARMVSFVAGGGDVGGIVKQTKFELTEAPVFNGSWTESNVPEAMRSLVV
jgi:hypothetical protein